jgi:hypothetical protein
MKEQMRRTEIAKMRFLKADAGQRMADHKRNYNIKEELGITYKYSDNKVSE